MRGLQRAPQLLALGACAALIFLFRSTVASAVLSDEAGTDALKVAALAPLAAGWLLWLRRQRLALLQARPWWPGLLGVAACAIAWTLGAVAQINALCQVALVAMLLATTLAVLGQASARTLALPILVLLFGVNAYFPLIDPLVWLAAHTGTAALRLTGIAARLEGLSIVTPAGRWQVIDGCSGIDYVLVFAMSAVVFSATALGAPIRRLAFVATAIAAALAANALRIWTIIFAATVSGGAEPSHEMVGWIAFSIVFALLFWFGRRFAAMESGAPRPAAAGAGAPGDLRGSAWIAAVALAVAAAAPAAAGALQARSSAPEAREGCRVLDQAPFEREGAHGTRVRNLCAGASAIEQARLLPKAALHRLSPEGAVVPGRRSIGLEGREAPIDAATLIALDRRESYRITYWYEIGGAASGSKVGLKWRAARELLEGRGTDVVVVTETERLDEVR